MRKIPALLRKETGSVVIIVAVALTVLLSFTALTVDLGRSYLAKTNLQTAVDASALAGAQQLPDTAAASEMANDYIEKNGFSGADITVTFPESGVIAVKGTTTVEFGFANVMGFGSQRVDCSAMAKRVSSTAPAFGFLLFSGSSSSDLILNGGGTYIGGSVHTNSNFLLNGSNSTIIGALSAGKGITINGGNQNIGSRHPYATAIAMPDYSAEILTQAQQAGQVYTSGKVYNGDVTLNSSVYIKGGDLNINSANFSGTGTILCENSIVINGRIKYKNTDSAVCLYSKNGNILINGGADSIYGILYAPKGTVIINGTSVIYGRIIANNIICNGKVTVYQVDDTAALPQTAGAGSKLVG